MSEHESPNQISSRTTPTWEVELLISGVAVFAMLQLPGLLDDAMFALAPRLDESWATLADLLFYYAKSATVILAATFVIHLLLRARWIALVGMHSVYPDGVRWEKLRMGPIQREIDQRYQISTEDVIESADNLATTVFATGVMLAMVLVGVTIGVGVALGSSTLIASFLGMEQGALALFGATFALLMSTYALATFLDRRYGARWKQGERRRKALGTVMRFFAGIGMRQSNNRIKVLLSSNSGDRRIGALIFLIITITIFLVMLANWGMRNGTRFGSYQFFPAHASAAIKSWHYGDQRNPARDPAVPFVQSMVPEGPYLELVIPYVPAQDEPQLQKYCVLPKVARDPALLACLQALHPVLLDGNPVPGLRYEIASDAQTSRPALLAMIDIRMLAPGRHELRIGRATLGGTSPDATTDDPEQTPSDTVIPFWR